MPQPAQHKNLPGGRFALWAAILLALLSCLPFLVTAHPQLTDYPSHLARYHVMLSRGDSTFLARYYDFSWILAGNLGADLLMVPLGKLFGVEAAAKLVGAIIPVLTGLGLVAVEWTLRRRIGVGTLLAFATIWSPAMGLGFYNFCLSLALALFAFAVWVRLEGRNWRWAAMVPAGLLVWLCHASGWGVLGVLVFGYEWHRRKNLSALFAPWPLFPPALAMLLVEVGAGSLNYGRSLANYKLGIWVKALRDQSFQLDFLSLVVIVVAILIALFLRRIDGRLGWAALMLALLTLVMPRHFGGGDFADLRLVAVALMIGSLAIDWQPPRAVLALAAALFLVRLGTTALAWHESDRALTAALGAIDHLPTGARVAGAVAVNAGDWAIDPMEHAPSYATVYRDALVNTHFAVPGVHMLGVRGPDGRGLRKDFADPLHRIFIMPGKPVDLTSFAPLRHADYLWYFGKVPADRMPPGARVLYRAQNTFLARLAKPGDER